MKHTTRLSWTIGLAIAAPVMALTGCPGLLGQPTGASPSPSAPAATPTPTPSPTPALRTTLVLTKVDIAGADTASRSFTVKNLGSADAVLGNYVVSYEYYPGGATSAVTTHLRFGKGITLKKGESVAIYDKTGCTDGKCVEKEEAIAVAPKNETLGIQAPHGAFALYKGVTASTDVKKENLVDYLQYGTATHSYAHAADAVSQKLWDGADKFAPAPGAVGKAIAVKTEGASGSTNWQ